MSSTKDLLRLLFRREDVVAALSEGPLDIRSLTAAVDVSRPTVHRTLKSFEDHDIIVETRSGYALTTYGELVFERYETTIQQFRALHQNKQLLLSLRDATAISEDLLDGASYTRAVPFAPEKPITEIESIVRDSSVVRGFSPVILSRYVTLFRERLLAGDFETEILLTSDVFEYLVSNWGTELEETIDAGFTCLVVDRSLPFGLVLVEEPHPRVCVVVYDDGTPRGIVQNDSRRAVEWARELYESYRAEAYRPDVLNE